MKEVVTVHGNISETDAIHKAVCSLSVSSVTLRLCHRSDASCPSGLVGVCVSDKDGCFGSDVVSAAEHSSMRASLSRTGVTGAGLTPERRLVHLRDIYTPRAEERSGSGSQKSGGRYRHLLRDLWSVK
ncbi:hypothetical protein PBY51_018540 [Eleginops maclovinus]|uniref:Uncharacterized protein n=1 Tax=Eleginops maclovinus TaxID=56733 RepID=A0AAN7Y7W4_ELEMC|nr:hypothetical protein PBY51_018540 [Eleginops maclovinus]